MTLRRILLAVFLLAVVAGGVMAWQIGPRNIIGMLRYDQRREGKLQVGDVAPDVELVRPDGGVVRLSQYFGDNPLPDFGSLHDPPSGARRSPGEIAREHAERARFLTITSGSHPTD